MQRNIEQLIQIISNSALDFSDRFFFNSLARQLQKNLLLTQNQYELAKSKILSNKQLISTLGIDNIDAAVEIVQLPFRVASKEKIIRLVESEILYKNYSKFYIEIKFPFNKKDINIVETIKKSFQKVGNSYYKKETSHFFLYNDDVLYQIINEFANRNFTVQHELNETYEKIKFIKENAHLYVPGVYGNKLKNIHASAENAIVNEIGELTADTAIKYLDRKTRFGLANIEFAEEFVKKIETHSPCVLKIASRTCADYLSRPDDETLQDLLSSLVVLDRFPLLVVLSNQISPSTVFEQLTGVHRILSNVFSNESQSVLFRLDNNLDTKSKEFNTYIKDNKINNWVDNSTKVVYINYDKLPKVILKSNWTPLATLSFSNLNRSDVSTYTNSVCDLNIVRERDFSIIKQYTKNK
jgi:hypothetical protein